MGNIKILIVDDLKLAHMPIGKFLQDFVFIENELIIIDAYNTTQAKHLLKQSEYNLVMLDGDVGGNWGYEIIQDILKNNKNITIISSSNHDDFNTRNVSMGSHGAINKTYIYDWNDKGGLFRTQKAKIIREIFYKRNSGNL